MIRIVSQIFVNGVTPKTGAEHELLFRGGFVEHLSRTYAEQQSVSQYITINYMILVTPKAGAWQELLLNKLVLDKCPLVC